MVDKGGKGKKARQAGLGWEEGGGEDGMGWLVWERVGADDDRRWTCQAVAIGRWAAVQCSRHATNITVLPCRDDRVESRRAGKE